ncbi:MAG: O-antigen ligase family protein, partial [Phycisphaerales bacterium]
LGAFQALVSHPVNLWFDVDPASDPFPFPGIAPSTGMAIDAVTVVLSAIAVVLTRALIDERAIAALAMAATGSAVAVLHAMSGGDQCWRGLQWIAAIMGATSIAVVLRALPESPARTVRAVVVGILVASAVPILWRGVLQVLVEHPQTVEAYLANRAEFLAARGWAEGSSQALTYERRLMQAEATAWFGLSNVASSVIGALAVVAGGAAIALWTPRRLGAVLAGLVSAAAFLTVALTGSKGAIAATAIGVAFAVLALRLPGAPRWRIGVALLFLALPVAAVAARGMAGLSLGERSLLFRSQYADGALQVFGAHPLIGVGPSGFGDAYLRVRPALAPEEVQSAHAAWADWIASLGQGGIAWIALLMLLVAWGAKAARTPDPQPAPVPAEELTRPRLAAALAVLAAAVVALVPEMHALDDHALLQRVLAALFAAIFAGILVRTAFLPGRALVAALGGAAVLLAVHAQVEMTLWWPGAVGWVACMIGAVAGGARPVAPPAASIGYIRRLVAIRLACACTIAVAAAMLTALVPQARAAERAVEAAAQPLAAFGRARLGLGPAPTRPIADDRLHLAALVYPETELPNRWLTRPSLRAAALSQLAAAVAGLSPTTPPEDAERIVDAAMRPFAQLPICEAEASAGGLVLEAILASAAPAAIARQPEADELQARWADLQVFFNPRSVRGLTRLADARTRADDAAGAADAARRALAADDSYLLDPLRQLPAAERARLERLATSAAPAPR